MSRAHNSPTSWGMTPASAAMSSGTVETFDDFVSAETTRLLRIAMHLTGNQHDAWDLVQEALVRIGTRWQKVADGNPAGYAHTIMIRLNIDRFRRQRRELPHDDVPIVDVPVVLDPGFDPVLVTALGRLSPQQRAAVVLRTIGDLDHAEIGARLGCSTATARTHLMRGLARLREELSELEVRGDA